MNDLTILVTENPALAAIPAALRDWSAAGLIRPFVWVPPPGAGLRGLEARLVEGGDVTASSIGELLARRSPTQVRVIALTSDLAVGADSTRVAREVIAGVSGAGGEIRVIPAQIVVTRLGVRTGRLTGVEGWHNLLISPDDAQGPAKPHNPLTGMAPDEDHARYALPAVAIVGALFDSLDAGPLDEENPPPGTQFRVLRAFARHLDGTAVREALQARALGLADGYPLVLDGGTTPATYIENIDHANAQMAAAVWARHQDVYLSARRRPELAPVEGLSFWKAFRMLWSFLWAALKNAPADWANKVIYTGKSWAANTATRAIFGQNSAFAVVVGGVRGGQASTWEAQVQALGALENGLDQAGEGHQVHARLDSLWQDLVAGGLTLLDGQPRRPEMDAARIGTDIGILRAGRQLAPSRATEAFTDIPGAVRAITESEALAPYDTLSVNRFGRRLTAVAADPLGGADASATMEKFQEWWRRVSTSYTTKIAGRLSTEFENRLLEISEYTKVLEAAGATSGLPDEIRRQQGRLARILRWLLIGLLLLVAGTVTLGVLAIIGWLVVGIIVPALILGWLLASVITFMRVQGRLFQLKNARAVALSNAAAAEYNLAAAIRDARRCGDAYRLLQLWAEALAVFVGDPLGRAGAQSPDDRGPGSDHPLAVQFGRAEVSDLEVARAANGIRRFVFPVGWLDGAWGTFLDAAGTLLGPRGGVLLDEPTQLYKQRAVQEDVLLPMWVEALATQGVPGTAGATLWEQIVAVLHSTAQAQRDQLLDRVRTEDGTTVTLSEFLGGLSGVIERPTVFPTALFSATAITQDLPQPRPPWSRERAEGLSRTVVLTQVSDAMPAEYLTPEDQPKPIPPIDPVDPTAEPRDPVVPPPIPPIPSPNPIF